MNPIYYTKVEFRSWTRMQVPRSIILLNVPERELSYQTFEYKRQMPAIQGVERLVFGEYEFMNYFDRPAKVLKNSKTDFVGRIIPDDEYFQDVSFSYGIRLSEEQMEELLPYCNALDFEPFRGRKMSMSDEGYIGYRDEVNLSFRAVTDSYIPLLELPMDYYYNEKHIWPSEKLYRYLVRTYFQGNKKLKRHDVYYGESSLFI